MNININKNHPDKLHYQSSPNLSGLLRAEMFFLRRLLKTSSILFGEDLEKLQLAAIFINNCLSCQLSILHGDNFYFVIRNFN